VQSLASQMGLSNRPDPLVELNDSFNNYLAKTQSDLDYNWNVVMPNDPYLAGGSIMDTVYDPALFAVSTFGLELAGPLLTDATMLTRVRTVAELDNVAAPTQNISTNVDDISRLLDTLEFRKRTLELGFDPSRNELLVREGIGAARFERATGRTVVRSMDGATDFIDQKLGAFDLKGPLRANDGSPIEITPKRIEGLGNSIIKEANFSTASKAVVVDTLGLTKIQISTLKTQVQIGMKVDKPIIYIE
jgi:hypothetical protein